MFFKAYAGFFQSMKILHLLGSSYDHGGIFSSLRSIISIDKENEHYVTVNERFVERRLPSLPLIRLPNQIAESNSFWKLIIKSLQGLSPVLNFIKHGDFDIIHAHHRGSYIQAALVGWLLKKPVVITLHNYASNPAFYRAYAYFTKSSIVCLTQEMIKYYKFPERYKDRIFLNPECYNNEKIRYYINTGVHGRKENVIRLIGLGALNERKGWKILIKALNQNSKHFRNRLKVDIYGGALDHHDQDKDELNRLISQYALQDIITIHDFQSEVLGHIQNADYLILPSIMEPCSVAILEALALGVPVIASRSGGCIDLIQHGFNGFLFEEKNERDLSELLLKISNKELIPKQSVEEIRKSIRFCSNEEVLKKNIEIYKTTISRLKRAS